MPRRARQQSALTNPTLIGALTILVAIVAVWLAYQANSGLPFVPRYDLHVQLRDANELTKGAEVHMGGSLVGMVSKVSPSYDAAGRPIAVADLQLNKSVQPLAVDSTFIVRLKGAIGLKYLQLVPGRARQTYIDGATVPVGQTSATVDLDQVFSMFDPLTRRGVTSTTVGFSDALAGRGTDVNNAIGAFVPLLNDLGPVARNLASRNTDLGGFFRGLAALAGALTPVADTQASLFTNLDTTFRALASVAVPQLQDFIHQTPPTFGTVIADSPNLQSFTTDTAALFSELRPGVATLPTTAPLLAAAFTAGARNLPSTSAPGGLDEQLLSLAQHLQRYGQTPAVNAGLDRATLTLARLRPPLAFLTPAQSTCNYVTLFLRNVASTLSDHTSSGTTLRFLIVAIDDVLGGEAVPSQHPYTTPSTSTLPEHGPLHVNPYPNTAAPGETQECEAGNEPYSSKQAVIGNAPGNQGLRTEKTSRSGK